PIKDRRRDDQMGEGVAQEPLLPSQPELLTESAARRGAGESRGGGDEQNGPQAEPSEVLQRFEAERILDEPAQRQRREHALGGIDRERDQQEPGRDVPGDFREQADRKGSQNEDPPPSRPGQQERAEQDRVRKPERRRACPAEGHPELVGDEVRRLEETEPERAAEERRTRDGSGIMDGLRVRGSGSGRGSRPAVTLQEH